MPGDAATSREDGTAPARTSDGLLLRVISAAVLAPLAIAAAYTGGWPFAAFWGVAAILILYEWLVITAAGRAAVAAGVAALLVAAALAVAGNLLLCVAAAGCGAVAIALLAASERRIWSAAGIVYASAAFLPAVALRSDAALGFVAIVFLFGVVWATDVFGYFVGRAIGGPKLWPAVSPKKTWSGAIGGALGAVAAALAIAGIGLRTGYRANLLAIAAVALLLSAVSQAGDLFESAVKRRFGVKDAGHVIPGHGGVMDRLDGFLFAAAVAAMIGLLRGGIGAPARGLLVW